VTDSGGLAAVGSSIQRYLNFAIRPGAAGGRQPAARVVGSHRGPRSGKSHRQHPVAAAIDAVPVSRRHQQRYARRLVGHRLPHRTLAPAVRPASSAYAVEGECGRRATHPRSDDAGVRHVAHSDRSHAATGGELAAAGCDPVSGGGCDRTAGHWASSGRPVNPTTSSSARATVTLPCAFKLGRTAVRAECEGRKRLEQFTAGDIVLRSH